MGKLAHRKTKSRQVRDASVRYAGVRMLDATPERIARAYHSEQVNPAEIDSSEQPIGRVRRFRDSAVDRLHRRGALTYAQWYACDWYVSLHAAAITTPRVVADYGRSHRGDGERNVGLPQSEAQLASRALLRTVRAKVLGTKVGVFEGLVVEDVMPSFTYGRGRDRYVRAMADMAQLVAEYIHAPGHHAR
jgi:hypothetical protein